MVDVVDDLLEERLQLATVAEETLALDALAEESLVHVNEAHRLHHLRPDGRPLTIWSLRLFFFSLYLNVYVALYC